VSLDELLHAVSAGLLHLFCDVAVGVEGKGSGVVAQVLRIVVAVGIGGLAGSGIAASRDLHHPLFILALRDAAASIGGALKHRDHRHFSCN